MDNETEKPQASTELGGRVDSVVMPETSPHYGDIRGFTQLSKAWYAKANLTDPNIKDEITIGFYSPGGGTSGEFQVVWEKLGVKWTPRLKAFDDAWSALFNFSDLIESMALVGGDDITPAAFVVVLECLGIKNMTPVEV